MEVTLCRTLMHPVIVIVPAHILWIATGSKLHKPHMLINMGNRNY